MENANFSLLMTDADFFYVSGGLQQAAAATAAAAVTAAAAGWWCSMAWHCHARLTWIPGETPLPRTRDRRSQPPRTHRTARTTAVYLSLGYFDFAFGNLILTDWMLNFLFLCF